MLEVIVIIGDLQQSIEKIIYEYLTDNLQLETTTTENYVGGMTDSGGLYKSSHVIKLRLGHKVISEAYLD